MAFILGLEEQKAALTRVKHGLTEVEKINKNLLNIQKFAADATKKEYKIECEYTLPDESLQRIKIPVVIDNTDFVYDALQKHKDEIVKKIREDATQYNISLSPQDEAILSGVPKTEK